MTDIDWKLKIDSKVWNKLTRDEQVLTLECIAESLEMFGDFEGQVEI